MTTVLAAVALFMLAFLGMAVGLLRGRVLQGSCGGSSAEGGSCGCTPKRKAACDLEKVRQAALRVQAERAGAAAEPAMDAEDACDVDGHHHPSAR